MSIRERLYDFLFYMLIGTLYCFALCSAVFDATILPVTYSRLLALSAICMLFFFVLFYNKWTMIGVGAAALLTLLVVFIVLWRQDFQAQWLSDLTAFGREIVLFYRGVVAYREEFGQVLPVITAALISFLAALNLRLEYNFLLLMLLGVGVIAIPIWADWGSSPVAIPVFLFCFLVLLTKRLNLFPLATSGGKNSRNDGFTLVMIPVSLFALVTASLIPAPNFAFSQIGAPVDTPDNIFELAGDLFGARGDATVAYSEEGSRLGGPNERGEKLIMEVKADERVYLTGSVRDTYTGSSWSVSDKARDEIPPDSGGSYKTSEYTADLQRQQDYYMRYYAQQTRSLTVYTATRTKSLFTPPYHTDLWFGDDDFSGSNTLRTSTLGALTAKKMLEQNTSYGQRYTAFNFTNSYIIQVLQDSAAPDAQSEALAPCLALPGDLPERVSDLAAELTAGSSNNYDKLRAIEKHLAQFPYTLTPDNVPRGEDFVDYFLFTGQEGYCVYYASALAVMGRAVGIPTRYVEGYAMPSSREENGNYRVTTLQAHAWTEAFFPGFGWVPFEPTPPSYALVYGEDPATIDPSPLPSETTDTPENTEPDAPEAEEPDTPGDPDEQSEQENPSRPEDTDKQPDEELPGSSEQTSANTLVVAILSLLAIAGLSALFVWVMRRTYRRKIDKLESLPDRESVTGYFACLLNAAATCGYPIRRGETAHQYASRVKDELRFADGAVDMGMLADIFARAAYGDLEIPPDDTALMKRCYRELLARLQKTKKGKLRYLVDRYLLMRF